MYKNVVFDCGQVLCHFSPDFIASHYVADEADRKKVIDVVFDRETVWDLLDANAISVDRAKEIFAERLDEKLCKAACDLLDNWMFDMPLFDGVTEFVKKLKNDGANIYLISNINMTFAEGYAKNPELKELFSYFSGLVFSAKESLVKPNPEIFNRLLERYSLNAEECVFVDDSTDNLKGAASVGMNTYHFDGDYGKLSEFLYK